MEFPGNIFKDILLRHHASPIQCTNYWNEITRAYTGRNRHYHNLSHLTQILTELEPVKHDINDWDVLLLSLIYHDIIYKPTRNDNEQKSAELALDRLHGILDDIQLIRIREHILATKTHLPHTDPDINYFTDADLSILGQPPENYASYLRNIRKEYRIYPDFIYTPGRRKVVKQFLNMQRIYKSDYFYSRYERAARANLREELGEK